MKKFYGDPVWIKNKEFKTITDFEHELANIRCENNRLFAEHSNLESKQRQFTKLEEDYVLTHKRFDFHLDQTEEITNGLSDKREFDRNKRANLGERIRQQNARI